MLPGSLGALMRVLSVLVFAAFAGQTTLAFAAVCDRLAGRDCCEHGEADERDEDEDQDEDQDDAGEHEGDERCPCPFPCAPGCAGTGVRALLLAPLELRERPALLLDLGHPDEARAPPSAEGPEILHVPKRARA